MPTDIAADRTQKAASQDNFERGVALALHLWADLAFAVENELGGAGGAAKRDWFAGAVVELFPSLQSQASPSPQQQPSNDDLLMDVESRLLQVMDDEFDTIVDDGSALEVAGQIVGLWRECRQGRFAEVDKLQRRWEAGKGKKVSALFSEGQHEDQDTDWDTDDGDDEQGEDGEDDVEMGDATAPAPVAREKPAPPEVDEDGFTKVTRKKR